LGLKVRAVATSGSACYVYSQAIFSTPNMTVGGVMLAMKADHAALTDWTFDFTATAATDSASLTATSQASRSALVMIQRV
jgi:PKD repeat protein